VAGSGGVGSGRDGCAVSWTIPTRSTKTNYAVLLHPETTLSRPYPTLERKKLAESMEKSVSRGGSWGGRTARPGVWSGVSLRTSRAAWCFLCDLLLYRAKTGCIVYISLSSGFLCVTCSNCVFGRVALQGFSGFDGCTVETSRYTVPWQPICALLVVFPPPCCLVNI